MLARKFNILFYLSKHTLFYPAIHSYIHTHKYICARACTHTHTHIYIYIHILFMNFYTEKTKQHLILKDHHIDFVTNYTYTDIFTHIYIHCSERFFLLTRITSIINRVRDIVAVNSCPNTTIYTHTHIYIHTHIFTQIYMHIYICTYTHTHTHIYIYVYIITAILPDGYLK